jgi:N-acetylmuramoyl-L-alanine amidase
MPFVFFLFTSFQPEPQNSIGVTKVVIDAGHGGHDSGCLGRKSKEKDIALSIALKLGKYIEDNFSDVEVIYTRKVDEFVELHERANIANNARADLFICIHCNSACTFNKKKKKEICNREIAGVESWVMGLNKTDENLEVSKRENEVILLEKDYTRQYDGFDPNSPEANIIFSLYQNSYLENSLRMASYVQQEVKAKGRPLRGVKQAGFLVLYKTSMPSVLIETGFLSNEAEEKYLSSPKGQDEIASAVFRAFKSYKHSVDVLKKDNQGEPIDNPEIKNIEVKPNVLKANRDTILKDTSKKVVRIIGPEVVMPTAIEGILQWSVQFHSSPTAIPDNDKIYETFDDVREDFEGGVYKYSTGLLTGKNEAIVLQKKIREMGYKDAFVIAFFNNKKISVKEATEKLQKK